MTKAKNSTGRKQGVPVKPLGNKLGGLVLTASTVATTRYATKLLTNENSLTGSKSLPVDM